MKTKTIKKTPAAKKCATKKCTVKKCAAKKPAAKAKVATKNVTFTFHGDKGKAVYVAGEFNRWSPSAKKLAYKATTGIYSTTVKLAAGTYQYKFVIDGAWCADPENANSVPNDQGTFNSVIVVK